MRGRWIPLSLPRRLVSDLLSFASKIPILPAQRQMRLGPLQAARVASSSRPAWLALFIKGFALAAQEFPELRRVYLQLPWPHLYEYPDSVAALTIERSIAEEPGVLVTRIDAPARLPISHPFLPVGPTAGARIRCWESTDSSHHADRGELLPDMRKIDRRFAHVAGSSFAPYNCGEPQRT